jgi:hypothetical protein
MDATSEPTEMLPKPLLHGLPSREEPPFLNPSPSIIAPGDDLLLGSIRRDRTLLDYLPAQDAADRLLEQYWDAVHPIARIVHRPTFEKRYILFWDQVMQGFEPTPSLQAAVFAALFTAAISMSEHEALGLFSVSRSELQHRFQLGVETALGKAHFLRTTKTETLQAFVMYLVLISHYCPQ